MFWSRASVLVLLTVGCARNLGPADASAYCARVDTRRTYASGIAAGAGVLAGAQGLAAIPERAPTSEDTRAGLAVGSVVAAGVAAGAAIVAERAAQAWARGCSP